MIPRKLGRMARTPHTLRCLLCKAILDHCALSSDEEYVAAAAEEMKAHQGADPNPSEGPSCRYADCVHHEGIERGMARAILRVSGRPGSLLDVRGVRYATSDFEATPEDHPPGFDMRRQDAAHRRFHFLKPAAGCVYVRMGPKRCEVHVWICPAFVSRRESADDPASLWEIKETYGPKLDGLRSWVLGKWEELKAMAVMDLQLEEGR
jgi:hypothetical protein